MLRKDYKVLWGYTYPNLDYSLAPLSLLDMGKIRGWRNSQMHVLRQSKKISFVGQIVYFIRAVWLEAMRSAPNQILLGINDGHKLIGYCGLVHVDWEEKISEVSFLLYNRECTRLQYKKIMFSALCGLEKAAQFTGIAKFTTETYDMPEREHHISCLEEYGFKLQRTAQNSVSRFPSLHHELILR